MAIFKCKMCGGALEIQENATVATCEYCGTQQTLPRLDDDRRVNLYDRANHFRRNNEFDKAMGIYEQILTEDSSDAEAYWSLVLCRYGIEYVEDPATRKRIPTVNRAQFTSIFDDADYKSAVANADGLQRAVYEEEARAINEIQKGILAISQQEEPFDVFICYKETDAHGRRTQDSVLANDLYHQLTQEGFKVFFARITLEDKLGVAYEPYIFAALNSAKVMVVLGTRPEHFNAVWVKNEWSRYLALIKSGGNKVLIPAYRDMDPYDLPEEFSHLQAQDMSKLGFMQDLIRGIKKIAADDSKKTPGHSMTAIQSEGGPNASALLKRGYMALEDGEWNKADDFFEQVLNMDAECAEAYSGKLMVELRVDERSKLGDCQDTFDSNKNYIRAVRYADDALRVELIGYTEAIKNRNAGAIYQQALAMKDADTTEEKFKKAAELFGSISWFQDAAQLAEDCRNEAIYQSATRRMTSALTVEEYLEAADKFDSIKEWKDSAGLCQRCHNEADSVRAMQEKVSGILVRWKQLDFREDALKNSRKNAFITKRKKFDNELEEIGQERVGLTNQLKQLPIDIAVRAMAAQGDTVLFGAFQQYEQPSKTAIEWKIIARGGQEMLITSTYALACMPFHKKSTYIAWQDCDLRAWLNKDFCSSAFTETERGLFARPRDGVFLLSPDEFVGHIPQQIDRIVTPSVYADISRGGDRGTDTGWWLRTSGINERYKTYVTPYGAVIDHGLEVSTKILVRPAIWISV